MVKVNSTTVETTLFPNNEKHYNFLPIIESISPNDTVVDIELKYETDLDLMTLWAVKRFLDDYVKRMFTKLVMYYVPYSRMDRETEDGQPCTLRYFADFINTLHFDRVWILDPHSNVTMALFDRCLTKIGGMGLILQWAAGESGADVICFPDLGASKKYDEMIDFDELPTFSAHKKRDISTGKLSGQFLIDPPDLTGKTVLIVDDICVRGGTAYGVAKLCKEAGAKKVAFYVTHMENRLDEGPILKDTMIDEVYTTNSLIFDPHEKVKVYEL